MTNYYTSGGVVFNNMTMEDVEYIDRLVKATKLVDWYDIAPIDECPDNATLKAIAFLATEQSNPNFYIDEIEMDRLIDGHNYSFANCLVYKKRVVIVDNDYNNLSWVVRAINMWYLGMPIGYNRYDNLEIVTSKNVKAKEVHSYIHAIAQVAACTDIMELASSPQVAKLAWKLASHEQYVDLGIAKDDGDSIVLFSSDGFDAEYITDLIQAILNALDSDEIVGYEWANTNDKRPWQHGGGACVVSRNDFEFMSSGEFMSLSGPEILEQRRKQND